jgi:hypothetical protein
VQCFAFPFTRAFSGKAAASSRTVETRNCKSRFEGCATPFTISRGQRLPDASALCGVPRSFVELILTASELRFGDPRTLLGVTEFLLRSVNDQLPRISFNPRPDIDHVRGNCTEGERDDNGRSFVSRGPPRAKRRQPSTDESTRARSR